MNLTAIFLPGQTDITVNGLHQWDYGQKLQINSSDLPALIEVHFSCVGMTDAIVRPCFMNGAGKGTVTIPDICLEQSTPITAWIFEVDGTTGTTTKTITLPIISRARPSKGDAVPEEIGDVYTEAVTEINGLVESLKAETIPEIIDSIESIKTETVTEINNLVEPLKNEVATEINDLVESLQAGDVIVAKATGDEMGAPITQKYARINYGKRCANNNSEWIVDPGVLFIYTQREGDSEDGLNAGIGEELAEGTELPAGTWGFYIGAGGHDSAYKVLGAVPDIIPVNRDAVVIGCVGTFDGTYPHKKYLIQVSGF